MLHQCCLEYDLSLLHAGDQTEVGERGLTLSGGQKARVTLARTVYSKAEILLLDDILAALECVEYIFYLPHSDCCPPSVHTAKWVVNRCLQGELIKGRTVILAVHYS